MNNKIFEKINTKKLSILVSFLSFGSVGAALISQHFFNMEPCAWCILQRMIFIIIGIISLFTYSFDKNKKLNISAWGLVSVFATCGVSAALYQLLVASKSFDCKVSLAEKIINFSNLNQLIPDVFGIFAMCGDANPSVFGIPYIIYPIVLFMVISTISSVSIVKTIRSN